MGGEKSQKGRPRAPTNRRSKGQDPQSVRVSFEMVPDFFTVESPDCWIMESPSKNVVSKSADVHLPFSCCPGSGNLRWPMIRSISLSQRSRPCPSK
jgi:hypothetical protein